MQRALVLCDGELVRDSHIIFEPPPTPLHAVATAVAQADSAAASNAEPAASVAIGAATAPAALADSLAQAERRILLEALRSNETRERIAERLGISPRTLRYKLARLRRMGLGSAA
jgi:two-component system response regulator FlrC